MMSEGVYSVKLWLVRHGETEANVAGLYSGHAPTPLTERGMMQARTLGQLLQAVTFDRVLCSELERTHITADLLRERYRGRVGLVMLTFIDVANAVLFVALLYGGLRLMQMAATQMTPGLGISKSWIYAALPLGSVLMLWELARLGVVRFRHPGATGRSDAPPVL